MYDPDYLSKSASKRKEARLYIIYFVVFAMSIIGAILMAKHDWKLISFKPDLSEDWNQIFLKYLFIIVAIERAAAVYVGIDRNQNKRKWKNRIKRVREILETNPTNLTVSKLYKTYLREKKIIASLEAQKETSGFLGVEDPDIPISTKVPADNERNRNELIAYLQTTKNVYEFKSEIYEEHTNTILARIVFIGGIIIAVVGLSIFNDIFELILNNL